MPQASNDARPQQAILDYLTQAGASQSSFQKLLKQTADEDLPSISMPITISIESSGSSTLLSLHQKCNDGATPSVLYMSLAEALSECLGNCPPATAELGLSVVFLPTAYLNSLMACFAGTLYERWLQLNCIGSGEARALACQPQPAGRSRWVPWVGVAIKFAVESGGCLRLVPGVEGQAFSFLPLPVKTGLPVHINANFELSSNRRDVWWGDDMRGDGAARALWNKALLVVTPPSPLSPFCCLLKTAFATVVENEVCLLDEMNCTCCA